MSRTLKAVRKRKKIIPAALASVVVLILADFVLAFLFGSQIRSSSPFAFGTNDEDTLISLLFLEGGVIFGLGAFFASGIADSKATIQTNARDAYGIEKSVSRVAEQRKKLVEELWENSKVTTRMDFQDKSARDCLRFILGIDNDNLCLPIWSVYLACF